VLAFCSRVQLPAIAKNVRPHFVTASGLFQGIARRDARTISSLCTEKWFAQGVTVFREGESADSLYVLKKGLVKLISLSDSGRETILHILKPDEVFGELLLSEENRPFTAIAIEDSRVTIISKQSLVELLSAVPIVAVNFIRLLSKRLATVERGLVEFSHTWSYDRLARVLLQLCEKYGEEVPTGTLINVRLTHEDLANLIGTSRETVTTQLNKFTRMGLLKREAKRFIVTKSSLTDFIRSEELRLKKDARKDGHRYGRGR
jgi:CRP/FNR family transcriptional regulator, cyclic AMP receptor protein